MSPRLPAKRVAGKSCSFTYEDGEGCKGSKVANSDLCQMHVSGGPAALAETKKRNATERAAVKERLSTMRKLDTYSDVVCLVEDLIFGALTDQIERQKVNACGMLIPYVLKAKKQRKKDETNSAAFGIYLQRTKESVRIQMSPDQMDAFLQSASNEDLQLEILRQAEASGNIIRTPKGDIIDVEPNGEPTFDTKTIRAVVKDSSFRALDTKGIKTIFHVVEAELPEIEVSDPRIKPGEYQHVYCEESLQPGAGEHQWETIMEQEVGGESEDTYLTFRCKRCGLVTSYKDHGEKCPALEGE